MSAREKLPAGWRWVQLGEVCENPTGQRNPTLAPDDAFVYVDISSVDNEQKRIVSPKSLLGIDAPSRARKIIRDGDVIVSTTRPNLNAVALVSVELDNQICSTGFCVLRPIRNTLDPGFLFAFVRTNVFVSSLSDLVKGALYPAVTDGQVLAQRLPLPPLPEQRRIAAVLEERLAAVERARQAARAQLAAARALPAAYLRAVFEGEEARGWESKHIGEIAVTTSGTTPSRGNESYYANGSTLWVKTGELVDGVIYSTEEHITEAALKETSLKLLPEGTLLVAMYGQGQTRGRTAILGVPATINQACFAILPNPERFSPWFLQYWFRHNYFRLRQESENRGGNQPNLNGQILNSLEVQLPGVATQERIVGVLRDKLSGAKSVVESITNQLQAIEQLPTVYLQQAFSGEL